MLILTRKKDDEIIINSDIRVKILSVSETQVKLGIIAPADIQIFRGEVFEKIKEQTIEASRQDKDIKVNIKNLKVNKLKDMPNGE
jgi:carbon storage regulator